MEQERKNFINQLLALRKTRKLNSKPEKAVFIYEESKKQNFPLSINFISQELNISSSQIKRALKAKREGREIGQKGRPPKLNQKEQKKLKQQIEDLTDEGKSMTITEVFNSANEMISKRKKYTELKENVEMNQIQSKQWIYYFTKTNQLKTATAKELETKRREVSKEEVSCFFAIVRNLLEKNGSYQPSLIINADETMVKLGNKTKVQVVTSKKKEKPIRERKQIQKHLTAMCGISADGKFLKPLMILPTKTLPRETFEKSQSIYSFNYHHGSKGFINRPVFEDWIRDTLIPFVIKQRGDSSERALLILDGHVSRESVIAIESLQKNSIDTIILPAHASHLLQPLDVLPFSTFKRLLAQEKNLDSLEGLLEAIENCLHIAFSPRSVRQAFSRAGIFPLEEEKILKHEFLIEEKKKPKDSPHQKKRIDISNSLLTDGLVIEKLLERQKKLQTKKNSPKKRRISKKKRKSKSKK
ncbi:protein derived from transposon [Anaeramoeba ignava]|uniref:Protein derived from transposon n=1 Tax=Anaeramoeba ignava TaxID=1746090 RepID=A0A9Q0RBH1_ANAIG|nr:protein derived from transposon [Anaeramoeba ignava]